MTISDVRGGQPPAAPAEAQDDVTAAPTGSPGRRYWPAIAFGLLLLFHVAVPAALAWQAALTVPTFHLDGAFQTASGLFRLSEGEWPGRDFFPYLGIGPVFLLYPFFLVLGGDLHASVLAAHFVALLSAQVVFAVLAALLTGRRSRWTMGLTAAVPLVLLTATTVWPDLGRVDSACGGCISLVRYAVDPGLSLRPLRGLAPYLLAFLAVVALSGRWRTRTAMIVLGTAAGTVGALWSNDYGLVSAGLLVLVVTAVQVHRRGSDRISSVAVLWGAAVGSYLVTGLLATGGHLLPYLRYNLVDVRGDQFWYFPGWAEEFKVYSAGDLARVMLEEKVGLALALLVVVCVLAYRARSLSLLLVAYVGAATMLGGLAATIGGHEGYYFWTFRFWGLVVTAIGAVVLVRKLVAGRLPAPADRRVGTAIRVTAGAVTAAALLAVCVVVVTDAADHRTALAADGRYAYDAELGGYLDARYADHVARARELDAPVVEEYAGLMSVVNGMNSELPVDSVIHALGDQRDAFAERLAARPEYVVSTAPGATQIMWPDDWASWAISANWWFYRELFRSYTPEQTSPMTLLWSRAAEPATWESVPCRVTGYGIEIDAPEGGLFEVQLDYRGPGQNARAFSMVRNYINSPVEAQGWLALDPGATSQTFPVYVHDSSTFGLKDIGGSGDPLTTVTGCSAEAIGFPQGATTMDLYGGMLLTSGALDYRATPADLNFGAWIHGVHTEKAAIALPATATNRKALRSAGSVRFADDDVRTIEDVMPTGNLLVVFVSGPVLDPGVAAFPRPFHLAD